MSWRPFAQRHPGIPELVGRELTGLRSGDLSGASLRDITATGEFEQILKESLPTAVRMVIGQARLHQRPRTVKTWRFRW